MDVVDRIQDLRDTHGTATGNQAEDLSVSMASRCLHKNRLLREVESPALMVFSRCVDMVLKDKFWGGLGSVRFNVVLKDLKALVQSK